MSSTVREALEAYVGGRVQADRVAIAVAVAYYGDADGGKREALRPLIDVIDRASPGVVELASGDGRSGFEIRLAERAFPQEYEAELRGAAEAVLSGWEMRDAACVASGRSTHPPSRIPHHGFFSWLRRLFNASA
jgi:hypothetical protein